MMMKWWGWGDPKVSFPLAKKPKFWPWVYRNLKVEMKNPTHHVDRSQVVMPKPIVNETFLTEMRSVLSPEQILMDDDSRLLRTYGKSYPDLFKVRNGVIERAPDAIVLPKSHDEVVKIVEAAHVNGVAIIAFGGGTNIAGCTNPDVNIRGMCVTLDLQLMNKVLSVDPASNTAVIQPGIRGPKLETDLQAQGFSLGHHPDSFEFSSLGGWLATRSAGMQSDAYGRIEDMLISVKLVTPSGVFESKKVPATSAGPDLKGLVIGSEGAFGIITECVMQVHPKPLVKDYCGYLFKTFEDGVNAIKECVMNGYTASCLRLQDEDETDLAFNLKSEKPKFQQMIQGVFKKYILMKGYTRPAIMVAGWEGDETPVAQKKAACEAIFKKHGAISLGGSVGKAWQEDKYNMPYLRDHIMDYNCAADVAETSTTWDQVMDLWLGVRRSFKAQLQKDNLLGYMGCHISHTYPTGGCLYFTYAFPMHDAKGFELKRYYTYKHLITQAIIDNGGTLSHHHAVGTEHLPWLEEEITPTGSRMLKGVKAALDPKNICNPGKLVGPVLTKVETPNFRGATISREERKAADLTI